MDTTLGEIRSYGPCEDRWEHLMEHLDPRPADDEPLPVARVLDVNGLDDTLWILSQKGKGRLLVRFAADCSERAVKRHWEPHYPDDRRPQEAIEAAWAWLENPTDENRKKARTAGRAADTAARHTVGQDAAASAAFWAAKAASLTAFWAAKAASLTAYWAASAAYRVSAAAADRVEEITWQAEHLRELLEAR